ncbi:MULTISPECIES: peptide ABC transporter substrate-binding protein [unclassified Microbacterium]|uniref:peptide ABC transporter substrate-binding protein n=1 Tax=unclassified Microbacterium TaxID=2609290 RepID=UPI00214D08C2|nr:MULTISPECIES: ABC transporter substrate-binding protein [unclassified Microbacterium]MCR2801281.1 ABC transporter substrate-binding protein [Microbacterium sp. zg.Y818]MCR2825854.1 ABC transporter substrate-binding protein [Microbacterium sp. zg.Y909]WIM21113.1 ABC transporter substrate-binding protein [Microbacterium sp. zg-Y818]
MDRNKNALAGLTLLTAGALALAGCAGGGGDEPEESGDAVATAIITTNGSEPENPLIPTMTNEVGGGMILDSVFAGLVSYEADGTAVNDMAEEITVEDPQNLTVKLKEGQLFTDGEEVTADNFINAWNQGALASNKHYNSYFFEDIEGFSYDEDTELTGLEMVDDYTFTIALNKPASDFAQRLGYSAYYPLPDVAFEDMEAFGENPIGNGPYMLDGEGAWQHNVQIDLVKNEDYDGVRQAQNGGLTITFYSSQDAAYADLLGGQVDVIDVIPPTSLATFESDLGEGAVNQPAAIFQSFTIPERLAHFSGEEGQLRRQAISMAINRDEITEKIFQGTRTPASDFTSPVIDGWSDSLEGAEVLEYNPERAAELWAEADAISPWDGSFQIGYNADGGHDQWVDAVSNSLKNNLGIEASGAPYPTLAELRELVNNDAITTAFRTGWQADYPGLYNFLGPLYATNAGSNDGDYSSAEFDGLLTAGISTTDTEEANALFSEAQSVLLQDLPVIPLWYANVTGGFAPTVQNVEFGWNSVPLFHLITKAE